MGDEATPVDEGNVTDEVAVSNESIGDIVDSLNWPKGGATDPATPKTEESVSTETGEGKEDKSKTAPPPATKPELLNDEDFGKLTLKDIENPAFDWSKVTPAQAKILKGWQADVTRHRQAIAEMRRAKPVDTSTPQPTETPDEDPTDKQNQEIVAGALRALGLDPEVVKDLVSDQVTAKGVAIAATSVPQYLEDEAFHAAVNTAIATDDYLTGLAESKNPNLVARAIQTAALQVENQSLTGKVKSFTDREADITAREKALAAKEAEVEAQLTKLNRAKPSIAGGSQQGKSPKAPSGPPSIREIADDIGVPDHIRVG